MGTHMNDPTEDQKREEICKNDSIAEGKGTLEEDRTFICDEYLRPMDYRSSGKDYSICTRLNVLRWPMEDDLVPEGFSDSQRFEALTRIQRYDGIDHALKSVSSPNWSVFTAPLARKSYLPKDSDAIKMCFGLRTLLSCAERDDTRSNRSKSSKTAGANLRTSENITQLVKSLDTSELPAPLTWSVDFTARKKNFGS